MATALDYVECLGKCSATDAHQYMLAYYDSEYGIYNHFNQSVRNPLALVTMHPAEDLNTNTLLELRLNRFVQSGVKDIFGISLKDYMSLPGDLCDMLDKISSEEITKKSEVTDTALDALKLK